MVRLKLFTSLLMGALTVFNAYSEELLVAYRSSKRDGPSAAYAIYETKLFRVNPRDRTTRQVFSDLGTSTILLYRCGSGGDPGWALGSGGTRVFGLGIERPRTGPIYVDCPEKGSVFEIEIDGSNRLRKVFDLGKPSTIYISPLGDRVSYLSLLPGNVCTLFFRQTKDGTTVRQIPLPYGCQDDTQLGWLRDGKRMYVHVPLGIGDDDLKTPEMRNAAGTYLASVDRAALEKVSSLPADRKGSTIYNCLEASPSGHYLSACVPDIHKPRITVTAKAMPSKIDVVLPPAGINSYINVIGWISK